MKKNNFRFFVFVFIFYFFKFLPLANSDTLDLPFNDPDVLISMDFQDASLKDLLKIFSVQSGLNFIASEAVQDRKITLYLDKVPIKEAMDQLFKANNLYYELNKDSNIFIVKDWGKPQIDTITRIYHLKYQSVSSANILREKSVLGEGGGGGGAAGGSDLESSIKQLLSPNGKISGDARTNSIIITDIPSRFTAIEQLIAKLDVPEPQVMMEVEILDVNKSVVDKLGVNWPQTLISLTVNGTRETRFPFGGVSGSGRSLSGGGTSGGSGGSSGGGSGSGSGSGSSGGDTAALGTSSSFGSWDASRFGPSILTLIGATLTLDFLRTQSDTKTLARPRILTLNNETAEIKITTSEALNPSQSAAGTAGLTTSTTSVERTETGVSLRVTPQINIDTGEITMLIIPKVSETKAGITIPTSAGNIVVKDPEERSTKSLVRIKDSETVIIGGLIRNEFSQTDTKLPILGDLPVIGALFRHKDKDKDNERELLVFITPHIIKEANIELAKAKNVVLPEREQNAVSGVERKSLIESSLNSFDSKR
ncbi:MAG: secretin N-terminal domain-containing protein [Deltaproteobacteria bacterium]